jgi:hypothetical protein
MRQFIAITILLLFIACSSEVKKRPKFSQKEIASLKLDSTRTLIVQKDSIVRIDLNRFLKKDKFNIGDMIKNIKLIPLETTDKSLIARIENIIITDSAIYIVDSYQGRGIAIFDIEGNFLRRINHGQGPEEIVKLNNIAFDEIAHELVVFHSHYFSFYTSTGKFKRREKVPLNARSFAIIPNGYFFHAANKVDNKHISTIKYQILITDRNFKLKSIGFPYLYEDNNSYEGGTS